LSGCSLGVFLDLRFFAVPCFPQMSGFVRFLAGTVFSESQHSSTGSRGGRGATRESPLCQALSARRNPQIRSAAVRSPSPVLCAAQSCVRNTGHTDLVCRLNFFENISVCRSPRSLTARGTGPPECGFPAVRLPMCSRVLPKLVSREGCLLDKHLFTPRGPSFGAGVLDRGYRGFPRYPLCVSRCLTGTEVGSKHKRLSR
jgi:hypothetical protein